MNWLRRLAQNRLLDVGAILIMASIVVLWAVILPPRWSDFDFNLYYVGSRTLLEGRNPYTTLQKPMSEALGFRFSEEYPVAGYPPSFLWLFTPLAALPPRVAFAIWVALEIGCLVAILWLMRWLLRGKLSSRGWLFVVALAISSRTVSYNFYFSQVQLLLAALVLAAYAAQRASRHGWACVAVSAAGILKFYPFVLLPWFVWSGGGGLRARLYRLAGAGGFVLTVMALTGPGLWRDFFQHGLPMGVGEEIGRTFHFSLPALVTNLGYLYHGFLPSPEAKQWWWSVGTIVGLAVIAAVYAVCIATHVDREAEFCLLCVAMLIGTVTVQGHYFVFLIFPLTVAAIRVAARPTPGKSVCLILLVVAANCVDPPESAFLWRYPLLYILVSNVPLYGLFGLGAFFWRELWVQRGSAPHLPCSRA